MGRKGSMNLQVITDSFVKDQSRRRNCQALSARIPTSPIKEPQRKLSSPDISSSPNKKTEKPALKIQTAPKSAIPKASDPRSGFPLSAIPKTAAPDLRISTLVTAGNKAAGPKTPLSASVKKNQGLSLPPPDIPEIDAPDTPVNVIYANAFFDNKTREDKETEAINKKVLKQQRKENIRNMRRERMKQPKDVRVALILGRLYDASHYELGPLSYWSDPEVENNEELKPKEVEPVEENKMKPKKIIPINPDEVDSDNELEEEKNLENEINHDKTNNVNAHPAWIPEDAGCSNVSCQRSATIVDGKLVKKNKRHYVAVASYYSNLYDPVLMKEREEEESRRLLERQRQSSIITEFIPMGKNVNSRNQNIGQNVNGDQYYNKINQDIKNKHYNKQNFNKNFNNNRYRKDENYNDAFNVSSKENRSQPQPNKRNNYYNKRSPTQRSPTQRSPVKSNNNYMNDSYNNQTYSYGYVYQYPVYQYYDPNMVQNYDYTNYGTGYGQNYNPGNNYYFSSSYGTSNNTQNNYKPRMNYQNNNNQNSFNRRNNNEAYNFRKYEKRVNIKS